MPSNSTPTHSRQIGILTQLLGNDSLAPMVEAATRTAQSHGFATTVMSSGASAHEELSAWDTLSRTDCEGFLVYLDCLDKDQLERLINTRKNIIPVNLNDVLAGATAACHLINNGHRHITMVTGPAHQRRVQHRSAGFIGRLNEPDSPPIQLQTLEADLSFEGGAEAMRQVLASEIKPSAVFFHSDPMALGARSICQKNRLRVPDDISILGSGNTIDNQHGRPTLCSVDTLLSQVGTYAANVLVNRLNGVQPDTATGIDEKQIQPALVSGCSVQDINDTAGAIANPDTIITKRECECLQWASIGKTSWEISQIVGVTESTIIYHLRNATHKLDAANRLHAVTKALKASIIDF